MFGLETSTLALLAIATAVVIGGFYFIWVRHKKPGIPVTKEQIGAKIADDADALREVITAEIRKWAAGLPESTMKDHYFDVDNFLMDVGRLPASYSSAVTLNGAVKRDGSTPAQAYTLDEKTGNVRRAVTTRELPANQ